MLFAVPVVAALVRAVVERGATAPCIPPQWEKAHAHGAIQIAGGHRNGREPFEAAEVRDEARPHSSPGCAQGQQPEGRVSRAASQRR
eukprot:8359573-Pyramimonas_sp.AAC.1